MRPELWNRIEELFHAAAALAGPEREEFLRRECDDAEVRREVASLLDAGTDAERSLATVVDGAAAEIAEVLEPARTGERIGPYRIVRRIGEGGMAVVYLAEQEVPVARRVALKILKIGLDTREVLGRFDAERQLLARLQHPAIARILDAGSTPSGRPYFVLELVEGVPITEYCDARRLSIRDRIELVRQVCRAIHHAHQKGIVHRDLKPSNILVGEQDGRPAAKVIDFGIAKVIEQEATRERLRTETRHGTLLGTWEYMSPEQAAGSEDLDTRTDIYSLGVILYELLAGEPPFDRGSLRRAGLGELARVLASTDPPRPSTRAATAHGLAIAERRGLDPLALRRRLRGDLDRIALRCLESDRERRYSSILDVAEDLERHLRHEPVTARPPTVRYRVTKFVRRNRPLVLSSVAIAAVLVAATFISLREAHRARVHERLAEAGQASALHEAYCSNLSAAMLAAELGQVQAARDRLGGIAEGMRGFEWHHLASGIDGSIARIEGSEPFIAVMMGGDGAVISTVTASGRVERWSVVTGELLGSVELGEPITGPAAFDRDADRLAAVHGADRRAIVLWDARSGARLGEAEAESPKVHAIAIDPAGMAVAFGGTRSTLIRFDGTPPLPVPGQPTQALAFSGDGARLAHAYNISNMGAGPGFVLDIDARTGAPRRGGQRPEAEQALTVAVDATGARLALGMQDKSAWIQDCATGEFVCELRGHLAAVTAVAWSPSGDRLATGSVDATVRIWDPGSGASLALLLGPNEKIERLGFSPGGDKVFALARGRAWVWEHPAPAEDTQLLRHGEYVYGVAFVEGGERLVTGGWDHRLRVWGAGTGDPLGSVPIGTILRGLRASRDGRVVVSADNANVRIRDGDLLRVRAELPKYPQGVLAIDLDAAGRRVAVRTPEALEVWELDPPTRLRRFERGCADFAGVAISPDGTRVATAIDPGDDHLAVGHPTGPLRGLNRGDILLAEVAGGDWARLTSDAGAICSLAFSPDGGTLACGGWRGAVDLRDGRTGATLGRLEGHRDKVFALAWSPDGRRLATGSNDTTIRLWDPARASPVATLTGHEDYVYALAFAPDGSSLASGSGDGTVRVWDTRTERERRGSRREAARAREAARPAVEALLAELGDPTTALGRLRSEPASPARTAAIEALIERALAAPP